uniref:Uncharacterized protein n=1 Tax=Aegilops tauschii TaxID=37682 RepID=M8CH41_AEGTA
MPEFLSAIGLPATDVGLYLSRALPVALPLRAPLVPMTCINGVGMATPEKLLYWDGDLDKDPEVTATATGLSIWPAYLRSTRLSVKIRGSVDATGLSRWPIRPTPASCRMGSPLSG